MVMPKPIALPRGAGEGLVRADRSYLLLGDRGLDLFGQLGDARAQRLESIGLALAEEVRDLLAVGDRRLVALLGEVDLLDRLLLDRRGGEHFAAMLGEVFHRPA